MTCPTCRPPETPLSYQHQDELYERGSRLTLCRTCNTWRWPWEYPPPEWPASGLRWVWCATCLEWQLMRGSEYLGRVTARDRRNRYAAIDTDYGVRIIHTGTLHDCARALVAEVRR